jgi:hypothetical protein
LMGFRNDWFGVDDKLSGRGVTDCLGHVAMIAELFRNLAIHKPVLDTTLVAVFIASEENQSVAGVGIDVMCAKGDFFGRLFHGLIIVFRRVGGVETRTCYLGGFGQFRSNAGYCRGGRLADGLCWEAVPFGPAA